MCSARSKGAIFQKSSIEGIVVFPKNIVTILGYLKDSNAAAYSVDTGIS